MEACAHVSTSSAARAVALCLALSAAVAARAEPFKLGPATIDFPVVPDTAELDEVTPFGDIERFAAIAVTPDCDYALFEHRYPPAFVERIGIESLLPSAVQGSVARLDARVSLLERGSTNGHPTVDMDFQITASKGSGAARYVRTGATVIEASVLCRPDAPEDLLFLRSLVVE